MNEQLFGLKIRNKLNAGNTSVSPQVAQRLHLARQAALVRHRAKGQGFSLGSGGAGLLHWVQESWAPWLSALAMVIAVSASDYWMSYQRAAQLGEIDSALLTDDLPITAYLDRGFDTWLSIYD